MRRRLSFLVLALVAGVVACGGGGGSSSGDHRFPDVKIAALAGGDVGSRDVLADGRPTVVAVWATWCVPCKEELPRLEELSASDQRVGVAAVNLGDDPAAITKFAADLGLTLPIYVDQQGLLTEALGVASVPATVFVRADGTIADTHFGALSAAELDAGVAALTAAT